MDVPTKANVGDKAMVLIGHELLACEVLRVNREYYHTGNSHPWYVVRLCNGGEMPCGDNSLFVRGEKPW